jgi:hypothetical protein
LLLIELVGTSREERTFSAPPFAVHFALQPQAHPLPGQVGPQVQMMQVQFALPQLVLVCSTGFIGVFMASLV